MIKVCHHPDCKTLTRHGLCKVHRQSEQISIAISIFLRQYPEQDIDDIELSGSRLPIRSNR